MTTSVDNSIDQSAHALPSLFITSHLAGRKSYHTAPSSAYHPL